MHAGEVSGDLDKICFRLSVLLEKMLLLQGKVMGALTYPAVTVVVVVGVIAAIMLIVVPQFKSLFSSYGAALPLPTAVLMMMSEFIQNFWWAIGIAAISGFVSFNIFRKGKGKPLVDQWLLTLPLIGPVMRKVYVSRFVRILATMMASGVSLTEGITTASNTVDNYVLNIAFNKSKESILGGGTLARPLEQTGLFPIMVVKMISIGEETGKMETMLNKAADFLDLEVDAAIDTMVTLIEPLMIVVLGGIILGVALALYIPMFEMGKVITG
jgi:type IV pilus assembly protein PilC